MLGTPDLLVDVHNEQAIERWMKRVEFGHILSVIALENERMIGYCILHTNEPPWIRHVGEIRMNLAGAYRGRGLGRTLAHEVFAIARERGLEKIWARMASSQEAAQKVFHKLGFHTEALLSDWSRPANPVDSLPRKRPTTCSRDSVEASNNGRLSESPELIVAQIAGLIAQDRWPHSPPCCSPRLLAHLHLVR